MDKSKEQTKPVKLEMLEYVSSIALLKSIRQVRKIHDVEAEDFIEKKLMDLGVRAVYPNQPFKYGYKRFYLNKKHLIKNPIGVRAPLTDEQLKIVAEFVGLARLEQCNSDTKYLRILKSLLVQRCNVQNPDELDWDDILTHIEVFLCKTEQKTKLGESGKTGDAEDAIITANNEPLSGKALAVLHLLREQPPNQGLTGPQILTKLDDKKIIISQSALTKSIIPALKPHGVRNKKRIGYYIHTK